MLLSWVGNPLWQANQKAYLWRPSSLVLHNQSGNGWAMPVLSTRKCYFCGDMVTDKQWGDWQLVSFSQTQISFSLKCQGCQGLSNTLLIHEVHAHTWCSEMVARGNDPMWLALDLTQDLDGLVSLTLESPLLRTSLRICNHQNVFSVFPGLCFDSTDIYFVSKWKIRIKKEQFSCAKYNW